MRVYGKIVLDKGSWAITTEPHVALKLKRIMGSAARKRGDVLRLPNTEENCRELLWITQRYPMVVKPAKALIKGAETHLRRATLFDAMLSGRVDPRTFDLAVPARPYQRVAADIALRNGYLLVADEVGLGKTVVAICMLTDPRTRPALVVTLTSLPRQWEAMFARFAPQLRVHAIKKGTPYDVTAIGGRGRQLGLAGADPDVLIINYAKLAGWSEALAGKIKTIVFDEAQELRHEKNGQKRSQKYDAAKAIARKAPFRLMLTATPVYNYGGEFWTVLNILKPGCLGAKREFTDDWCVTAYGDKPRVKDPKAFGTYLREAGIMIRRTRHEVGRELPPFTVVPHFVDCNEEEIKRVQGNAAELARIILAQSESHRGAKMQASEELNVMLRQATGLGKAPYVAEFVRLLVESGEKVLLYGWHHVVYDLWRDLLADCKPVFYTGRESTNQRDEAKKAFVEGDSMVLAMSVRAGAGLDGLQYACRTIVHGELDWSPGVHEQDDGRVFRDGQKDPVVSYYLISESGSDPIVADILGLKRQQIEGVLNPKSRSVELVDAGGMNARKLAEGFLRQRGLYVPSQGAA